MVPKYTYKTIEVLFSNDSGKVLEIHYREVPRGLEGILYAINSKKLRAKSQFLDKINRYSPEEFYYIVKISYYKGSKYLVKVITPIKKEKFRYKMEEIRSVRNEILSWAYENGFDVYIDKRYNSPAFEVYWLIRKNLAIRVGIPYLIPGKACWITGYYIDSETNRMKRITRTTKIPVRKWGRAPEGRIYHGYKGFVEKLIKRINETYEKLKDYEYYPKTLDEDIPSVKIKENWEKIDVPIEIKIPAIKAKNPPIDIFLL